MLLPDNHPEKGFTWELGLSDLNFEIDWEPHCSVSVLLIERLGFITFHLL